MKKGLGTPPLNSGPPSNLGPPRYSLPQDSPLNSPNIKKNDPPPRKKCYKTHSGHPPHFS